MPDVQTRYVTWVRRGIRGHGSAATDIVPPLTTAATDGGSYEAWASPSITWTDSDGMHTASFAFWSVTGAADGASISTADSVDVSVGDTDIAATAWYVEGGGNGGPGYFVDSFDVDLGTFVDDDFVSVTSDPSLSANANSTGWVPTTSAETIEAFGSIHGGAPFDDWLVLATDQTVSSQDLKLAALTSGIAFAFYKTPVSPHRFTNVPVDSTWVSWGVTVDGGGPTGHGPVQPWGPFVVKLAAGLALADAAGQVDERLRAEVLDIAAKQVELAARSITEAMGAGG
jgi:hypothetical protein